MAEVSVVVHPKHAVILEEVELDIKQAGQPRSKVINYNVSCATCGWYSPTHFRSRVAAKTTGREHCDDNADTGLMWVTVLEATG